MNKGRKWEIKRQKGMEKRELKKKKCRKKERREAINKRTHEIGARLYTMPSYQREGRLIPYPEAFERTPSKNHDKASHPHRSIEP